jgi:phage protein D
MARQPFYSVLVAKENIDLVEKYGVVSFTYEESNGKDNLLTLQLKNQNLELLDEKWFVEGTELTFLFGYKGEEQSEQKQAIITTIEPRYGLDISVTIKATDKGNYLKKANNNKVWNGTATEIAKQIAGQYDLEFVGEMTTKKYEEYSQGNLTDFDFLKKLATENNLHFHVSNNQLFFRKRQLGANSTITYTYRNGNGKLKSFVPKSKGLQDNGLGAGATFTAINPDTNKAETVKVDGNKVDNNTALGNVNNYFDLNGTFKNKDKNETTKQVVVPTTNDTNTTKNNLSNKVANQQLSNMEASISLEGEPQLKEGMIITIAGVAQKHAGNYYVETVRHTISSGGFETTAELKKNATLKPTTNNSSTTGTDKNTSTGGKEVADKKLVKNVNYNNEGKKV